MYHDIAVAPQHHQLHSAIQWLELRHHQLADALQHMSSSEDPKE